jgi:hypothetical protein
VLAKHLPKFIPFTSAPWRSTIDKDVGARLLLPRCTSHVITYSQLTRRVCAVNCYVSDPLTYTFPFGMRAGWCWEMLQAMQRVTSVRLPDSVALRLRALQSETVR